MHRYWSLISVRFAGPTKWSGSHSSGLCRASLAKPAWLQPPPGFRGVKNDAKQWCEAIGFFRIIVQQFSNRRTKFPIQNLKKMMRINCENAATCCEMMRVVESPKNYQNLTGSDASCPSCCSYPCSCFWLLFPNGDVFPIWGKIQRRLLCQSNVARGKPQQVRLLSQQSGHQLWGSQLLHPTPRSRRTKRQRWRL